MNTKHRTQRNSVRLAVLCLTAVLLGASGFPPQAQTPSRDADVPLPLVGRVNDYAGVLTGRQVANLSRMLEAFEQRTGSQVVILIVNSTGARSIEDYSLLTMNAWGIGRAEYNDGAGIIVAVTDRTARIELGLGLEPFFSDEQAAEIMNTAMIPEFRRGNIYTGVQKGAQAVMQRIEAGMPTHWRP
jgi:uncharacterized protein